MRASVNGWLGAGADLAALQQGIDLSLGLGLGDAVLGGDLSHEVGLALEGRDVLRREFAPLGAIILDNSLLLVGILRIC